MESIVCRRCNTPKAPCLFTPADVKAAIRRRGKLVSVCRSCRKTVRARYQIKPANPGDWRVSMKAIFGRDLEERKRSA